MDPGNVAIISYRSIEYRVRLVRAGFFAAEAFMNEALHTDKLKWQYMFHWVHTRIVWARSWYSEAHQQVCGCVSNLLCASRPCSQVALLAFRRVLNEAGIRACMHAGEPMVLMGTRLSQGVRSRVPKFWTH